MRLHERAVAAIARPAAAEPEAGGGGGGGDAGGGGGGAAAGMTALASPSPGLFRIAVRPGDLVRPGSVLGELELLGRRIAVTAPDGVRGAVVSTCAGGLARPAVDHGAVLVTVDPRALAGDALGAGAGDAAAASSPAGHVFRSPAAGRFYGRPAPGKPPYVTAGAELVAGATICLLEVMKTFQRVSYSGEPARVVRVLVSDGDDVNVGDPLLALE